MNINLLTSKSEWLQAWAVMKQLRPALSQDEFIELVEIQQSQGYCLAGVSLNGQMIAVAGFVIASKLAWGKHLYVDDLVTDERHRGSGAGKALLDWLKDHARQQQCRELHLDSGVQRFAAHRFYLREGFDIASHHFRCSL